MVLSTNMEETLGSDRKDSKEPSRLGRKQSVGRGSAPGREECEPGTHWETCGQQEDPRVSPGPTGRLVGSDPGHDSFCTVTKRPGF